MGWGNPSPYAEMKRWRLDKIRLQRQLEDCAFCISPYAECQVHRP